MERLRVGDLDWLLDAERDNQEEGKSVEAVDVDQLDGGPLHLHGGPLHQRQVTPLGEDAEKAVDVGLPIKFLQVFLYAISVTRWQD